MHDGNECQALKVGYRVDYNIAGRMPDGCWPVSLLALCLAKVGNVEADAWSTRPGVPALRPSSVTKRHRDV